MSGFKLIATRPLKDCNNKFLKVLKAGEIYQFYNDFHFRLQDQNDIHSEVEEITYTPTIPDDLYDIKKDDGEVLKVNISAIVGKNGSGKSSLLELLFLSIFVISSKSEILPDLTFLEAEIERIEQLEGSYPYDIAYNKEFLEELQFIDNEFKVDIYFSQENEIFRIRIENARIEHDIPALIDPNLNNDKNLIYKIKNLTDKNNINLSDFFYTIAVNYSIYGLNPKYSGKWINTVFHKNDGYQTPLVLNPMKTDGNFDINLETYLAQSRLLANLIDQKMEVRKILGNKIITKIEFGIIQNKVREFNKIDLNNVVDALVKHYGLNSVEIFAKVYNKILGVKFDKLDKPKPRIAHFDIIVKYVIKKLYKIASTYEEYKKYYSLPDKSILIPVIVDIDSFLDDLRLDNSHITLKIKQLLNSVRFDILREDIEKGIVWDENIFCLTSEQFIERITKVHSLNKEIPIIELVPVALYNPKISVKDNSLEQQIMGSEFHSLSSGEQQLVHSIQSILYHLINLNSVFNSNKEISKKNEFRYVNIVLDEIEICFHPEFQRSFIKELLIGISQLSIPNIKGVNILFSTHSPYLLSDIPNSNILKLRGGKIEDYKSQALTFGANIHDLLANDFFMQDGFMGEFAQDKINKVIGFLRSEVDYGDYTDINKIQQIRSIINMIGEPVIKNRLEKLFHEKYPAFSDENNSFKEKVKIQREILRQLELKILKDK